MQNDVKQQYVQYILLVANRRSALGERTLSGTWLTVSRGGNKPYVAENFSPTERETLSKENPTVRIQDLNLLFPSEAQRPEQHYKYEAADARCCVVRLGSLTTFDINLTPLTFIPLLRKVEPQT